MYTAEPSAAESLVTARQLAERAHSDVDLAGILCDQGALALASGQLDRARQFLEEALQLADRVEPVFAARSRCLLAEVA
ncbi:MAG: hypothetical protein ACLQVK_22875, partial [Acidimicrobiales bacterium]